MSAAWLGKASCTIEAVETPQWTELRSRMITEQLVPRGIHDRRVLEAMRSVPRHLFVPEAVRSRSYEDKALPTVAGQTISQPLMVALMLQSLNLRGTEKVLEIGSGTGYQATLLGRLAREIHTVELISDLAEQARANLLAIGTPNIHLHVGDGSQGLPEHAPYQVIVVAASAPDVPAALIDQLAPEGLLLIPIGDRKQQRLTLFQKKASEMMRQTLLSCSFVPLRGAFGWPQA
jgi:protein-L-isoaspartate(D-aspartate) O-methyltransferase